MSVDRKRKANFVVPHYPYYLVPLIFHFWGYVKDNVYSHRINMVV